MVAGRQFALGRYMIGGGGGDMIGGGGCDMIGGGGCCQRLVVLEGAMSNGSK